LEARAGKEMALWAARKAAARTAEGVRVAGLEANMAAEEMEVLTGWVEARAAADHSHQGVLAAGAGTAVGSQAEAREAAAPAAESKELGNLAGEGKAMRVVAVEVGVAA